MSQISHTTTIKVTKPEKVGDGINAYVRYTVITETNNPKMGGSRFETFRRFREFHALYEFLVDTYRQKGICIPHPPEKSVAATTKVKVLSKDATEIVQIEQRRLGLERYMNRIVQHPTLSQDDRVIEFLKELVFTQKARDRFLKLSQNVSSTFSKLKPDFDDYEQWYEEKVMKLETLETNFNALNMAGRYQYSYRSDYVNAARKFSLASINLCSTESNQTIAKALTSIASAKDKTARIYEKQMLNDLHEIIGTSRDYLDDIISLKHLFGEYTKKISALKSVDSKITSKKESLSKSENVERPEKVAIMKAELEELERLKAFSSKDLTEFTEVFKSEIDRFDEERVRTMRESFIRYIRGLKEMHEEMISVWESNLPSCHGII